MMEYLPSSGKDAGRICRGVLEVGNPSAIEMAESNRNLGLLQHSLVMEYVQIVWMGLVSDGTLLVPWYPSLPRPFTFSGE